MKAVVEERVYNSETATPSEYLRFVYNNEINVPQIDRTNIEELMALRLAGVERSIESGDTEVQKKVI